ncbi:Uncharacterised protein [Streptococcus anginosus]|uniref:Uncharacterized protein n=1 Tax=Streptococcus anginosus TaxID=1328 RepID=A0A3S4QNJ9_STRAP|nr:Uncharacterised protein [Streptococcus anginosus]
MDTAVRVVIALGGVLAIVGLGWVLTGAFDYFAGRKNGNPQMDGSGDDLNDLWRSHRSDCSRSCSSHCSCYACHYILEKSD